MRKTHPDTLAGVKAMFRETALDTLADAVEKMVADETARWIPDPQVEQVWGLEDRATGKILVVAYLADYDFEIAEAGMDLPGIV